MAKKKVVSKAKKAMSSEHMKEYGKMSPKMLKEHMKEEKVLLKQKVKKK